MWYNRNPFADLDDLPDKRALGWRLLLVGLLLAGVRVAWPRLGTASFSWASEFFYHYLDFLGHRSARSPADFGNLFVLAALICLICGAFILFRRFVWWLQERRESDVTQLKL